MSQREKRKENNPLSPPANNKSPAAVPKSISRTVHLVFREYTALALLCSLFSLFSRQVAVPAARKLVVKIRSFGFTIASPHCAIGMSPSHHQVGTNNRPTIALPRLQAAAARSLVCPPSAPSAYRILRDFSVCGSPAYQNLLAWC